MVRSLALALILIAPQISFPQQAPLASTMAAARRTLARVDLSPTSRRLSFFDSTALPAEGAGLPVPLRIVSVAHGVGAAGLGWDIPFSYIQRDRTFAHRRPAYGQ
jgi:hypothetical protein